MPLKSDCRATFFFRTGSAALTLPPACVCLVAVPPLQPPRLSHALWATACARVTRVRLTTRPPLFPTSCHGRHPAAHPECDVCHPRHQHCPSMDWHRHARASHCFLHHPSKNQRVCGHGSRAFDSQACQDPTSQAPPAPPSQPIFSELARDSATNLRAPPLFPTSCRCLPTAAHPGFELIPVGTSFP